MKTEKQKQAWYLYKKLSYKEMFEYLNKSSFSDEESSWVFRGQPAEKQLVTSLERYCIKSLIGLEGAKKVEKMAIREFRRLYNGEDREDVMNDTLYCMSLLRHYGAPSRLLDFSYSKFIGIYFGLKEAYERIETEKSVDPKSKIGFSLWCIDAKDMNKKVEEVYKNSPNFLRAYRSRANVGSRKDKPFKELYMNEKYDLVISENPARIHSRLHLQQGVHLCPGKVSKPFMDILRSVYNSGYTEKIQALECSLTIEELQEAFEEFRNMNITEESLFPGLDGQARSVRYQLSYLLKLSKKIEAAGGNLE